MDQTKSCRGCGWKIVGAPERRFYCPVCDPAGEREARALRAHLQDHLASLKNKHEELRAEGERQRIAGEDDSRTMVRAANVAHSIERLRDELAGR